MNLGLLNGAGNSMHTYANQKGRVSGQNRDVNFDSFLLTKQTQITENMQGMGKTGTSNTDTYTEYLKSKYGNVSSQSVGKDQSNIDKLGASTAGAGNVVIAPDILEEMANNPEKAAYYEGKIQNYFNSVPRYQAELSAMGHEIHSSGIIIHPDGTVTHYISGDLKPEVRAKIEAKIKAEKEMKAKRHQEYAEIGQSAAEKRRQIMEYNQQKQVLAENVKNQLLTTKQTSDIGISTFVIANALSVYNKK